MKSVLLTICLLIAAAAMTNASEETDNAKYEVELMIYSGRENPIIRIEEGRLYKVIEDALQRAKYETDLENVYRNESELMRLGYTGFKIRVFDSSGKELGIALVTPTDELSIILLRYFITNELVSEKQANRLQSYLE